MAEFIENLGLFDRDIRAPAVKLSLLAGQICLVSWILR